MSKRRGPGLLRSMTRAAAVTAAATASHRAVNSRLDQRELRSQQNQASMIPQQGQPQPVMTPVAQTDLLSQLQQLAQLKESGALTEEEFQLAKARILG